MPTITRPSGVEGFLPISALLGLRYLVDTGSYDPAHPAGLTIFLFAIVTALLLRKGFCGYVCPVGLLSHLLSQVGRRIRWERSVSARIEVISSLPGHLLAGAFVAVVWFGMNSRAISTFMLDAFNLTADAHLLRFFLHPSFVTLAVFAILALVTLFFRNAWCRWLCPYGAFLGFLALMGTTSIRRDAEACVGCRACERACPSHLPISRKRVIRSTQCIGCARCVGACTRHKAVAMTMFGRLVHWSVVGLATLGGFVCFWLVANITGHWDSQLPTAMLNSLYAGVFHSAP